MVRFGFFVFFLFVFFSAGVMGLYENCTGQIDRIQDGTCDMENNSLDCAYDGGDCYGFSCTNNHIHPCCIWSFNCSDHDITGDERDYYNETESVRHCASDTPKTWLVNDTASAISLAEAVNCSGGTFSVTWLGSVFVNRTFYIPNNTTLYVTGEGSGAEVNGGGKTRLFMAVGADLHLEGLILRNGNATYGGGIAATRSSIFLNQTVFSDNTASIYGGAINVGVASTLVLEGQTMFTGNYAGQGGGAVAVNMGSVVSQDHFSFNVAVRNDSSGSAGYVNDHRTALWDGVTYFAYNTAGLYGGAVYVSSDSVMSLDGETSFVNNTANYFGGALCVALGSNVSWDGETSLVNNTANHSGGALFVSSDSIISWDGATSVVNNTSSYYGGAVFVAVGSTVSWDAETSFIGNTANSDGGALYISLASIVSWDGDTTFVNNTSNNYGGVFFVAWGSNVSWDTETLFMGNKASHSGGAFTIVFGCIISWEGETSFVGNTANYFGGAFVVGLDSHVSWDGETSFVGNTANLDGGALFVVWYSTVFVDGETTFVGNRANLDGGALSIYRNSNVSLDGNTSFIENVAYSSGGAISVKTGSKIFLGGETCFSDNEAAIDGGAAYVYVERDDATASNFISDNNSSVLSQGNSCGGNGGAIAFIGEVVTRFSVNMTFLKNTAGIAGGAIYISGVTIGMRFEGMVFKSNSAVIGGGLYATGSGTAVTEVVFGKLEYHPTTLIGCKFIGNEAIKTGGAMDSGAGRDLIVNSSFVGNTASLGGALKVVGTTSLIGCDFVNNLSDDDNGPGISNDGVITSASNCSFVGNVFNCQAGFFLANNDTDALFNTVCKGCDTQCTGCTIKDREPICLEELEHSYSTGGKTSLKSLTIERGYWRAANTSTNILACYNTDACRGGLTGDQGYCSEGYEGPCENKETLYEDCSVCSERYTGNLGFTCTKCSDSAAGVIALTVTMIVVFLLTSVAFLTYMLSGETEAIDRSIVARVTRFIPLYSVKIVIVVWQILTQFFTVANVVFPSVYQKFLDGVDILNFDLTWLFSAECIIDTDFHDQLLLATLGPLVCIVILGSTYVAAMRRSRDSETARGIARQKHVSMVLLLTFLVYSSVSSTLFKAFACDNLDDGKNYLRADYRIECDSFKHEALEIYAGFMVILYVVGIPAFYGVLLYTNRQALMNKTGRDEDGSIKFITDLWKPYKPDQFYYEVIECIRRVLLTGALVFIYPNTAAQIAVALMMATFFMIVSEALAPYASSWDTWISRTGHVIVFTSMFLALLLKLDVSGERASSQEVFEWVLIGAHSCLVLVIVVEAMAMIAAWRQYVVEDNDPRIRPSALSLGVSRVGTIRINDRVLPPYEDFVRNMLQR